MFKYVLLLFVLIHHSAFATPAQAGETLEESFRAFFAAQPSALGAVAELENVPHLPLIQLKKGEVRWSLPRLSHLPKRVAIIAEQGKGKHLRRWYINTPVRWMAEVVILSEDISARTMLDKSMLIRKRTNIAGLRGQTWSRKDDVMGLKSLRNLRKGAVIVSSQMQRPPLIVRGDLVTILVEVNGIKVRTKGIALKSGSRGDRMLVKNISSKKTLQSTVQDAHTVAVYLGGA